VDERGDYHRDGREIPFEPRLSYALSPAWNAVHYNRTVGSASVLNIRPRVTFLILALILLGSAVLGGLMLDRGHDWGDDFAQYISQAQGIAHGNMDEVVRRNAFTIRLSPITLGLTSYPWGFPLLLAPVYAVAGMDFLALKVVVTASYVAFLAVFFLWSRTRLDALESLLLVALMAFNTSMLHAENQILVDLPFLAWSTASLWLIDAAINTDSPRPPPMLASAALGLTIFMAAFTRLNGVLLLLPLAGAQFARRRFTGQLDPGLPRFLLRTAIPYFTFGLCFGLQALVFPSQPGGLQHAFDGFPGLMLAQHLAYYFWVTGRVFQFAGSAGVGLYALLLVLFVARLLAFRRRDLPPLLYAAATLILYIVYPPLQGPRFLYPILPIFLLFAFDGVGALARRFAPDHQRGVLIALYVIWSSVTVAYGAASIADVRSNLEAGRAAPSGPFSADASAMFGFIRQSTPTDSVVIFFKPRAMRLFTDRDSFIATNCLELQHGDYLVIMRDQGDYNQLSPASLEDCRLVGLPPVFEAGNAAVYSISR
jgi:hypothetical protein